VANPNGPASPSDTSLQRKMGGASGSCVDTGDSAADFLATTPSAPQNLASAPTP